ncbi:MAG TPA: MarR family winged helix-turn-helix transcriptional regulator [Drouetiella sp.]
MNTARISAKKGPDDGAMSSAKQVVETIPTIMRLIRSGVRRGGSLSLPQLRVLGYVSRNPGAGVVDVATHLDVTPPTASALVERLVRKKLVDRKDHPLERRRTTLTLTEDGEEVLEAARGKAQTLVAQALKDQTPEQLSKINEGLAILAEATKGMAL